VSEVPLAQALVVCDTVIEDKGSGKTSLIGIFNGITSGAFPVQINEICVYAALTNGHGLSEITLRCVRLNDDLETLRKIGSITFRDPNTVVELVFRLRGVPFPAPGLYAFELLCEGQLLLEKRFNVQQVDPRPAKNPLP
jgi:hypothetical protein